MTEMRRTEDEQQAELESRLARFDTWPASAIGARMHDIDRLRLVNLATERDEDEYVALAAALAAKNVSIPRSAPMSDNVTFMPCWTGSGIVYRPFRDDNLGLFERRHWSDEEKLIFDVWSSEERKRIERRLRPTVTARLRERGFDYDGLPLRGRR